MIVQAVLTLSMNVPLSSTYESTLELVSRFGLYGRLQQGMCRPVIHRIARLGERERGYSV